MIDGAYSCEKGQKVNFRRHKKENFVDAKNKERNFYSF